MASEGQLPPFNPAEAKEAMKELMKTPQGKEIAEKIKAKLRDLDLQFQGLSDGDKGEFMKKFKGKFSESFDELRESIQKNIINSEPEDSFNSGDSALPTSDSNEFNPLNAVVQPDYKLFLIAFIFIALIFGFFGYKLYTSIMEKEMKKDRKSKKELKKEKKTQSPPSSPRSKKEQ